MSAPAPSLTGRVYIKTQAHQRRAESLKGEPVLIGKMEHDFPYKGDGRGVYKEAAFSSIL